jgi:glycosidase
VTDALTQYESAWTGLHRCQVKHAPGAMGMRQRLACLSMLVALALLAAPGHAAQPRITSVTPTATGWQVSITGIASPEFQLDGKAMTARRVEGGHGDGGGIWEIPTAEAAAPARLVVVDGKRAVLAVRLAPDSSAEAPFNDWAIYHIMLEDFANGDSGNDRAGLRRWVHPNYAGGDLQGVLSKVEYLKSVGVNAVWLSPLFATETSHGYDVMNYYRVGDAVSVPRNREAAMQLYQRMVDALHAAGIRVILDLPLNHASGNYERRDGDPKGFKPKSTSAQQEAEKLWESWNTGWRYWNFDDASTREFLKDVGRFWLTEGRVDGLRLDYVRGVPHDFWAQFYKAMKAVKPGAFLFGEAWSDAAAPGPNADDIATYYAPVPGIGPQFDGLIGFPMQMVMTEVFARGAHGATELEYWLQHTSALYGVEGRPVYFLDNHDMSRFLAWTDEHGQERLLAALGFMASLSSPMVIFYGTETGITGGHAEFGFTDSGRIPMPWKSLDTGLIGRVAAILKARAQLPAITRGARLPIFCDDKVLVMRKHHPSGDVLVAVNLGDAERSVQLSAADVGIGGTWEAVLGNNAPRIATDGSITWTLPPLSTTWARR